MKIEDLFFQLLQVAVGNRNTLDRTPSAKEWKELFDLSKKQALTAIAFQGVTRLNVASDYGASLGIPEVVYLKWLGLTAKVVQRNKELNAECAKVCAELAHDGLQCCVLKGQSNLVNYPEELRGCRTAGDIDLWTLPHPEGIPIAVASNDSAEYVNYKGIAGVVEYAQQWRRRHNQDFIPWHRVLYYHVELNTDSGTEVELHYRPTYLNSPIRNYRLQRWFRENVPWGVCDAKIDDHVFPVATVEFNTVYQLLHIYKHLFEGGIGLRQLMDYYFVLKTLPSSKHRDVMILIGRFGMKKFASATMYVLQTVFAMPDVYLLCEADEREGRFLLDEIMQAGNFGKYDGRIKHGGSQLSHAIEKTKHNLRLIGHYSSEVLWEPIFRVYHWLWRKLELWRW